MDLYVAPSLLRAIRSPEYFQLAPVLIRIDPSIPGMEVANQMAQLWKLQIGSFVPSMNMFGVTLPTYILDDVAAIDAVTEMHLDTPQFAFNAPMGLPPLPMPTGMMPAGAPPGLPPALAGVFQDPEIRLTEEGWIPTAESIKVTNIPKLWEAGFNGEGVDVAVLDTGCDNNNPQLNGVVVKKSTMKLFPTGDDANGHGCIEPDAMVMTSAGGLDRIDSLYHRLSAMYGSRSSSVGETVTPEMPIYTIGFDEGTKLTRVMGVHKIPIDEEVVEVKYGSQKFITTSWHPFLVRDRRNGKPKYVRADELNCNHIFVRPKELDGRWDAPDLAYLTGLCIGDGHLPKRASDGVLIFYGDRDPSSLREYLQKRGHIVSRHSDGGFKVSKSLRYQMEKMGVPVGKKSHKVEVPQRIFGANSETRHAFIAGIVDSDGSFDKDRPRIRIVTVSRKLAKGLVSLLSMMGYRTGWTEQKPSKGHELNGYWVEGNYNTYTVSVSGPTAHQLVERIRPYLHLKEPNEDWAPGRDHHTPKVRKFDYHGHFYDFTTGTQNYLAGRQGMAFIHNTWCITSIKGKAMRHPVNGLPMAGGAPGCNMTSWKVLGYGIGTGATSDIMAAIDGAVQDGSQVISMSLGSDGRDDEENDPMVRQINMYAREKPQVLIVVANGNSGPDPKTVGVPAVAEGAISVGSYGIIDSAMAYFSSRGPTLQAGRIKPDIAAPGGGRALSETRPKETLFSGVSIGSMLDGFTDKVTDGFATLAGTSMGCPHVAAILANWKQAKPDLTGDDVRTIFRQSSGRKQNNDYGFGLIDATWILNY